MSGAATADVLIRCDVGPSQGVGHLMRCLALAEELVSRDRRVLFVADVDSVPFALDQLMRRGLDHVPAVSSAQEHVDLVRAHAPELVVVDSYVLSPEVYAALRAEAPTLLAIVDGDPAGRVADVLLDQNIGAEDDHWELPAGSLRLGGLRHALMRDDIRGLRPAQPRTVDEEPPRVLAFFGGTDAYAAAPVLVRALASTGAAYTLTVVAARPDLRAELEQLAASSPRHQQTEVIAPTEQIADLVVAADLVVSAAGTSTWELLCLGAACALVAVAPNQSESYDRVTGAGLATGLGYLDQLRIDPGLAVGRLAELLGSPALRAGLRVGGWREVDGRGRERVVDACSSGTPRSVTAT